ncbi:MAG: hypothetical protein GF399_02195 [Candidatus Coatesbacteria bacterium]|nr:hypothetical protein [Candidatus Coatesbacteria bacterium]
MSPWRLKRRILFAGGKTGGHLFPGVAVGAEIQRLRPDVEINFCGAGFELPRRVCSKRGWHYHYVPAAPVYQTDFLELLRGMLINFHGVTAARVLLRVLEPQLVVVCGGYEGFPVALAARMLHVPVLLLEQNAVPGLTNRVLSPLASAAAVAFPESAAILNMGRALVTGNPVRTELTAFPADYSVFGLEADRLTGLVIGGSAGARSLNEAVIDAAPRLAELEVQWILQTGEAMRDAVEGAVRRAGLRAHVAAFLDPVGAAFAISDFAVARSGGGAFELAACGIPAIFVPYPHAAADHQRANARAFTAAGAAFLVDDAELDAERLIAEVRRLAEDAALRDRMAAAMRRLGRPDAAERAARLALQTAGPATPAENGRNA